MPISEDAIHYQDDYGYCTVGDVKTAMQDLMRGTDPSAEQAVAAVRGETEWVRRRTRRHWFDPDADNTDGSTPDVTLPTGPRPITDETCDIPSSPHPQTGQLPSNERRAYPNPSRGSYVRVGLARRDVTTLDSLRVRGHREFDDWIAASDRDEGRASDYYLDVDPHTGRSAVYLDTRGLAPALDYGGAVVVSYSYGASPIPGSVRRATALRAAAELFAPQDSNAQVPEEGNLTNPKSKADELREDADRLLKPYKSVAVA